MLATTGSPWPAACRTSPRWPSCRLPIVGTKAHPPGVPSAARSSAMVWMSCIVGGRFTSVVHAEALEQRPVGLHVGVARGEQLVAVEDRVRAGEKAERL